MTISRVRLAVLAALMALVLGLVAFLVVVEDQKPEAAPYECPPLVSRDTEYALMDYFDVLIWNGVGYISKEDIGVDAPPPHGKQLTTVGCSIAELTADNDLTVQTYPWPDRTAMFLRSGSPVFAIDGVDPKCRVVVHDRSWKTYAEQDAETGKPTPPCE